MLFFVFSVILYSWVSQYFYFNNKLMEKTLLAQFQWHFPAQDPATNRDPTGRPFQNTAIIRRQQSGPIVLGAFTAELDFTVREGTCLSTMAAWPLRHQNLRNQFSFGWDADRWLMTAGVVVLSTIVLEAQALNTSENLVQLGARLIDFSRTPGKVRLGLTGIVETTQTSSPSLPRSTGSTLELLCISRVSSWIRIDLIRFKHTLQSYLGWARGNKIYCSKG